MTWAGWNGPSAEPSTEPSTITCSIEGWDGPVPLSEKKTPMPCSGSSSVVPVNWKGCRGVRKVDVRKGNKKTVHLIITMIKWIRTSRLSIKNSLFKVSG